MESHQASLPSSKKEKKKKKNEEERDKRGNRAVPNLHVYSTLFGENTDTSSHQLSP